METASAATSSLMFPLISVSIHVLEEQITNVQKK